MSPSKIIGLVCVVAGCLALGACREDLTPCEVDLDCLILCDCPFRDGTTTIGPYTCRSGNCGVRHAEDRDCERVCGSGPTLFPDDDDSGTSDDDDSAFDDDDSAP